MGSPLRPRRGHPEPLDDVGLVLFAADALVRMMSELRRSVVHTGAGGTATPVLLAEAHLLEAVGILRTISAKPRAETQVVPAIPPTAAA
ncbi:MAG: hypothetical protein WCA00_07325 [Candidatus Acidiferrales bacterium]